MCFCARTAVGCTSNCPLIPRCTTRQIGRSSDSQRNLPRRFTSRILLPINAETGAIEAGLSALGWWVEALKIFLPITYFASPARTVSTSGNSGIFIFYELLVPHELI